MSHTLIKCSDDKSQRVVGDGGEQYSTRFKASSRLKWLWAVVVLSTITIGCLGGLLVYMSGDDIHLILAMGMIASAAMVVGVTGYIGWQSALSDERNHVAQDSINGLETGVVVTDRSGKVVASNQRMQKLFGVVRGNVFDKFIAKFTDPLAANELNALCKKAQQDTSSQVEVVLQPNGDSQASVWRVKTYPVDNHKGHVMWLFNHLAQQQQCLNFKFFKSFSDFQVIFEHAPMGIVLLDTQAKIIGCNHFFREQIFSDAMVHNDTLFFDLLKGDCRQDIATVVGKMLAGESVSMPIEVIFSNQKTQCFSVFATCVNEKGERSITGKDASGIILHFFDNSEQKKLYAQLLQSQKMQALGQLAGGIAHDFNNLLTAMIGFCDLLIARHPQGDQSFPDIMHIKQNANRAANLVRQLLAFSKQQTLQPRVLSVNDTISDLSTLLYQLVGVNIDLQIMQGRDLGSVKVDKGQFEQVIINLVVNARDAMSSEGALIIKTSEKVYRSPKRIHDETIPPGTYTLIEVVDTGCGIPKENISRIFDPFFSTKELGQGTGLGLSMAYGIVQQTGGYIHVDSEVGKGTKLSVIIPCYESAGAPVSLVRQSNTQKALADLNGSGTILFVEDEDEVRTFGSRALKDKGYKVVEASNGDEAIGLVNSIRDQEDEKIDLMITDVVMPAMDGPTLVKRVHGICPELKVIYMSGYAEDSFRDKVGQDENIHFLPKPFSLQQLASMVKNVMNGHAG